EAPRGPFLAVGRERELIELPPVTYRVAGMNLPVAGGGYFRLFPLGSMRAGLRQVARAAPPAVGMLYFHPWEFDLDQPRLPAQRGAGEGASALASPDRTSAARAGGWAMARTWPLVGVVLAAGCQVPAARPAGCAGGNAGGFVARDTAAAVLFRPARSAAAAVL